MKLGVLFGKLVTHHVIIIVGFVWLFEIKWSITVDSPLLLYKCTVSTHSLPETHVNHAKLMAIGISGVKGVKTQLNPSAPRDACWPC